MGAAAGGTNRKGFNRIREQRIARQTAGSAARFCATPVIESGKRIVKHRPNSGPVAIRGCAGADREITAEASH
jgi:hypothetical protein